MWSQKICLSRKNDKFEICQSVCTNPSPASIQWSWTARNCRYMLSTFKRILSALSVFASTFMQEFLCALIIVAKSFMQEFKTSHFWMRLGILRPFWFSKFVVKTYLSLLMKSRNICSILLLFVWELKLCLYKKVCQIDI